MLTIAVCVGSSCHLKGPRSDLQVSGLDSQMGAAGTGRAEGRFCMNHCTEQYLLGSMTGRQSPFLSMV